MAVSNRLQRKRRQHRIRKRILGTPERPRLQVFRSNKHLHAQIIDDLQGKTLFSFSTNSSKFRKAFPKGGTVGGAQKLGEVFASELKTKKIQRIVFDRAGYQYHGRIQALAESLRKAGVDF